MYRLMIVDNEQLIRQSLHYAIDWQAMDVEVVCEASNGYDAMRLAGIFHPDIVITDIRMPIMDGLEFAQNLRKVMPSVYIIMLSGYSDMAYFQQAIKIGINVYLMKTADSTPIIREVELAKQIIDRQRADKQENVILQSILDNYLQSIVCNFVGDLLTRKKSTQYLQTICQQLHLPLKGPCYLLLLREWGREDADVDIARIQVALGGFNAVAAVVEKDTLAVILSLGAWDEGARSELEAHLADLAGDQAAWRAHMLCSEPVDHLEELADQYRGMIDKLPALFWRGETLLPVQSVGPRPAQNDLLIREQDILDAMHKLDRGRFDASIQTYADEARTAMIPCAELKASLMRLQMASRTIWHSDRPLALSKNLRNPEEWMQSLRSLYPSEESTQGLAESARAYIEQRYAEQISLSSIAAAFYVSPSHLSRMFKQQFRVGVKQYINICRIRRARQLLDQGEYRMAEIAEKVGYRDYRRFAENFQKYTSISLRLYRKAAQEDEDAP